MNIFLNLQKPIPEIMKTYHICVFPHTKLIAVFHPATATGKLNAVIIPTNPRGFHCSKSAWFGPEIKNFQSYQIHGNTSLIYHNTVVSLNKLNRLQGSHSNFRHFLLYLPILFALFCQKTSLFISFSSKINNFFLLFLDFLPGGTLVVRYMFLLMISL